MLSDRTPDCIESRNLVLEPFTHRALAQRPPLNRPPPPDERPMADVIDLDRVRRLWVPENEISSDQRFSLR